jgi:hypothetical protein
MVTRDTLIKSRSRSIAKRWIKRLLMWLVACVIVWGAWKLALVHDWLRWYSNGYLAKQIPRPSAASISPRSCRFTVVDSGKESQRTRELGAEVVRRWEGGVLTDDELGLALAGAMDVRADTQVCVSEGERRQVVFVVACLGEPVLTLIEKKRFCLSVGEWHLLEEGQILERFNLDTIWGYRPVDFLTESVPWTSSARPDDIGALQVVGTICLVDSVKGRIIYDWALSSPVVRSEW